MTRKILAVLLALCMVFALALTSCGAAEEAGKNEKVTSKAAEKEEKKDTAGPAVAGETETVDWFCRRDLTNVTDFADYVEPWLYDYMLENYNIELFYHGFGSADYTTKFNAAISAGTGCDLFFLAQTTNGNLYVWYNRGALEPLDDLIVEYAPKLLEVLPDWAWAGTSINGVKYAITTYKDLATDIGMFYNETMLEETGLTEAYEAVEFIKAADYDEFFHTVKAARDELHPDIADIAAVKLTTTNWSYFKADWLSEGVYTSIPGLTCFENYPSDQVFNLYDTEDYYDMIALINKWVKDNIYPYDSNNYDTENEYYKTGKFFGTFEWGEMCPEREAYFEYGGWYEGLMHPKYAFTYTMQMQDCMQCINANTTDSKKVAAMIAYNALCEDSEVSTAMRFGTEGTHWIKTTDAKGNTRAEFNFEGGRNADSSKRNFYIWYFAEFGDLSSIYIPTTQPDDFLDIMVRINNEAKASDNMGFMFETTNVENEIAAVANVISEYNQDLMYGMLDNYAEQIDAFKASLTGNGIDAIVAEAQSQLDAFLGK